MDKSTTPADGRDLTNTERDIEAVKVAMFRYTWSLDMKDWRTLEDCFTPNISFAASDMGHYDGARNLIAKFQARTIRVPVRRHSVFNPYVRIDGNSAELTAYILNNRVRPRAVDGEFSMAGGFYRNTFERTPAGWKMSALRWHGFFFEGNPRLDPKLPIGPRPLPVMSGPQDSPWGGASAKGGDPDVSDMRLVRDLYTGMLRAADAGVYADVAAAFTEDAKADLKGLGIASGPEAIAAAISTAGGSDWTMHIVSNEKTSVVNDEARFGAYVYRVAPTEDASVGHSGGVMTGLARRTADGWRIAECTIHLLWEKGLPVIEDQLRTSKAHVLVEARKLWANESTRQIGTPEEEAAALLWKYTWSFDLNDIEQNRACFADDVDVTIVLDTTVRHVGAYDWVTANMANRARQTVTLHYVSNVICEKHFDSDTVDLKTYTITRRTTVGDPGQVMIAGGHYTCTAQKTDGEWRFATFAYHRSHGAYM